MDEVLVKEDNESSFDDQNKKLDKLNDLALIGECRIRLYVLLYYLKNICNDDCQIFLKKSILLILSNN